MEYVIYVIFISGISFFIFLLIKYAITYNLVSKKGIIDKLEIKCGGKFGDFYLSYPFVSVIFYDKYLAIVHSGHRNLIYYKNINSIDYVKGLLSSGIKIIAYNYDEYIIWIMHPDKILKFIWERKLTTAST